MLLHTDLAACKMELGKIRGDIRKLKSELAGYIHLLGDAQWDSKVLELKSKIEVLELQKPSLESKIIFLQTEIENAAIAPILETKEELQESILANQKQVKELKKDIRAQSKPNEIIAAPQLENEVLALQNLILQQQQKIKKLGTNEKIEAVKKIVRKGNNSMKERDKRKMAAILNKENKKQKPEPKTPIRLSDHALLRYVQRTRGIDVDAYAKRILSPKFLREIGEAADGTYDCGAYKCVIVNRVIVTIL